VLRRCPTAMAHAPNLSAAAPFSSTAHVGSPQHFEQLSHFTTDSGVAQVQAAIRVQQEGQLWNRFLAAVHAGL
jgi:hypothetical protein